MSDKFFKEVLIIHHSPFVEEDKLNAIREQIKDRLDSQGVPNDPTVIQFNNTGSVGAGDVLTFAWSAGYSVSTQRLGEPVRFGEETGTVSHNDDVNVFLGKREAKLGTMTKNFVNAIANYIEQQGDGEGFPSSQVKTLINDFRDVFPRLEATRI